MTISPAEALTRCIEHREIFHDEMLHLMRLLMRGEMSPQIASALLMGLRVKKETVGEITAAAQVMRHAMHAEADGSARRLAPAVLRVLVDDLGEGLVAWALGATDEAAAPQRVGVVLRAWARCRLP